MTDLKSFFFNPIFPNKTSLRGSHQTISLDTIKAASSDAHGDREHSFFLVSSLGVR